jgi:hypothetical protein
LVINGFLDGQVKERWQDFENRAILEFQTPDELGVARRETGRKRKETPAMAAFMNEQLTKSKRGRKSSKTFSSHFESDSTSTSSTTTTIRTEAELQADAIRLHDVPRDQWPDDVLTYQRDADRNRKRKAAEMQAEDALKRTTTSLRTSNDFFSERFRPM